MLVTYFSKFYHLSGKELFIRFTARAFRKLLTLFVFSYFPFDFESRLWDLIVSVPDHCLSFFSVSSQCARGKSSVARKPEDHPQIFKW